MKFSDLIPAFLTHKRADVITILDANARRDYAEITRIAHRIKAKATVRIQTMTEMGRSPSRPPRRDDGAVAVPACQLLNYMDRRDVFQLSKD